MKYISIDINLRSPIALMNCCKPGTHQYLNRHVLLTPLNPKSRLTLLSIPGINGALKAWQTRHFTCLINFLSLDDQIVELLADRHVEIE